MRRLAVVACALLAAGCASGARATLGPQEIGAVAALADQPDDAPRVAVVRSATVAKAPVRAEEGFLRHLFGLGRAAEHAQGHAEDAVLMGGDELFKGPHVARPQPVEQFRRIGGISFSHV